MMNGIAALAEPDFSESGVPFSTNALRLHVSADSLSLIYNGITRFTTNSHGLDVSAWPDGAVCVVEVEGVSGRTEFVDLDNMKGWREDAAPVTFYEGSFTNAPDGMMVRSWMGDAAVYLNWSHARGTATYVTNGRVMLLPGDNSGEKTWLNARKDFQNDLRLDVSAGDVAEVRVALRDLVNGVAKIGLMPEYFPGDLYYQYKAPALYLQTSNNLQGQTIFELYRHHGPWGDRVLIRRNTQYAYVGGQTITLQVSTNGCRIWYGTNVVVNQSDGNGTNWLHGITNAVQIYADGVFPHLEFLNQANQNNATVRLDELQVRTRTDFGTP